MPRTVKDLIAATGLSEPTVLTALACGELPGYRVGRRWTVPDEAFDRFCRGEWQPQTRNPFPDGVQPFPTPQSKIRSRASSGSDSPLLDTVTAIRAENAPDADLQIARAICNSFNGIPTVTPAVLAAREEAAQVILPRMAAINGPQIAEELERVRAEIVAEGQMVIDAFVSVIYEFRDSAEESRP